MSCRAIHNRRRLSSTSRIPFYVAMITASYGIQPCMNTAVLATVAHSASCRRLTPTRAYLVYPSIPGYGSYVDCLCSELFHPKMQSPLLYDMEHFRLLLHVRELNFPISWDDWRRMV
jgi:hypothetical protein